MSEKAKTSVEKELTKAQENFESFDNSIKEMTLDRANQAPKLEVEQQTKLSSKEIANSKDIYLKPVKTISSKEPFNEKFRADYNFAKEYVCFIAEHKEIIGETLDLWTKAFPGVAAEEWLVPTNKPVFGPRYLAEQIKKCSYHRFIMNDQVIPRGEHGTIYSSMAVDTTVQRLDAIPVNKNKSIFSGPTTFQ